MEGEVSRVELQTKQQSDWAVLVGRRSRTGWLLVKDIEWECWGQKEKTNPKVKLLVLSSWDELRDELCSGVSSSGQVYFCEEKENSGFWSSNWTSEKMHFEPWSDEKIPVISLKVLFAQEFILFFSSTQFTLQKEKKSKIRLKELPPCRLSIPCCNSQTMLNS